MAQPLKPEPSKADFKHRLELQATALVASATGGTGDLLVVEALLEACNLLEVSSCSDAPLVAVERDVRSNSGVYHLFVRRLNTSVPSGKFQILITRELASGLIY